MYFKDETEISELVRAFETCEINPAEFKHHHHLAVALWYLKHLPYEEASDKVRGGLRRLAAAFGSSGYNETITVFWLKMVASFLANTDLREPIFESANRLAGKFGNKDVIANYYSGETIASAKAKNEWVEPDLKALEFDRVKV